MSDSLEPAQDGAGTIAEGLLAENPPESESTNPFSLTEDHEFKAAEVDRIDVYSMPVGQEPILIASVLPNGNPIVIAHALPGTPESPFRKCPCIGVMPGRACPRCNCSKWVKECPKCHGERFLTVHSRKGAHSRTEMCGFCMGLGQVAARMEEVNAAEEAARAVRPIVGQDRPVYARGPQLPGVRQNTFSSRAAKKAVKRPGKRVARG